MYDNCDTCHLSRTTCLTRAAGTGLCAGVFTDRSSVSLSLMNIGAAFRSAFVLLSTEYCLRL